MRKLLILIAFFAMLLLPQGMWAQSSYYDIYVGSFTNGTAIQITDANAGDVLGDGSASVTYDVVNNELTLNNATINGCIYTYGDLTIKLIGQNTINAADSSAIKNRQPEYEYSIGMATAITPSGTITFTSTDESCSLRMTSQSTYSVSYPCCDCFANHNYGGLKHWGEVGDETVFSSLVAANILGGGSGTEGAPFLINNTTDLTNFATFVNSGLDGDGVFFLLNDNIDCKDLNNFEPIGYRTVLYPDAPNFLGTFDGGNHTISNIIYNPNVINPQTSDGIGLFGYVSGTIKNLTLLNCKFGGGYCNGAIAEFFGGLMENCTVSSCTIGDGENCGGLAGYVDGLSPSTSIKNCKLIDCTIQNGTNMGGISYLATGGVSIQNCIVDGCIFTTAVDNASIGGIVGFNNADNISNCIVKGTSITCSANSLAAAIALDANSCTFFGNYYYGDVTITIGGTTLSGHTQRGSGYYDNSQNYVHSDIPVDGGAVLYTKLLTLSHGGNSNVVPNSYYLQSSADVYAVAPGLTIQLTVTPVGTYLPKDATVTYKSASGADETITPTKAADSYTYSFTMPDAEATFALTYATDLSSNSYSYQVASQDYTGSAVVLPTVTMQNPTSVAATPLTPGTDYTIEGYKDSQKQALNSAPVDAGSYYVTIKGMGNYAGTVDVAFTINQIDLNNVTIAAIGDQTYTGSAIEPAVTVTMNGASVNANEYTIGYSNNTNATTANSLATVTLTSTGKNYTAATTKSATFNIVKAAAAISYAITSVSKTFGDATFTNALTNTGDGAVSYASSNTTVANIDAATGEVTIVGPGSATITATVTDGANYSYATPTATYTLTVGTSDMNVSATGYTGTYDGQAHGITVTAPDGATVKYGETDGTYNLDASPTYTNAGTYTVYYQVTKPGYTTVTSRATVTISKAKATVKYERYEFTVKIGESFNAPYVTVDPQGLTLTYRSTDTEVATVNAQTGEVTLIAPGKVNIYAEFAGDENYEAASDYYILTVLQRDIEPIDEDVVYSMNDNDFITTNDEGNQEEVKLDNTVIYDILYTLDTSGDPSESDGYDETEQCVVLNHSMKDNDVNRIINKDIKPGTDEYADEYTGLTFLVPAGKGYVIIDSRTDGEYQMMVKIGELAPVAFNHPNREKDSVFYECSAPTWVYVYNGGKVSNARMDANHRAKKTKGYVKIYSVTRSSSVGDGIERINMDALEESDRWYDLQGNRINRPTKKGIYILRGQKVIVK